jgi:hypothetical protein
MFNLSAGLSYVSIKDQVVRACALVDSLSATGFLKAAGDDASVFDLVVIGAGAAGVTAAWRAASLGARVCVIEKSGAPFPAQATCNDRIVSFSMYDWPESFAGAGVFPSLSGMPLAGKGIDGDMFPCYCDSPTPESASSLAAKWTARLDTTGTQLCASTAKYPIVWHFNAVAVPPPPFAPSMFSNEPATLKVTVVGSAGGGSDLHTANLIVATGVGLERPVGTYRPAPFWHDDLRAPWHRKVKGPSQNPRSVVISGAGDGAIQDALKSLWEADPKDLMPVAERLLKLGSATGRKQDILAAERHAERQLLWGVDETETYSGLQAVFDEIIGSIKPAQLKYWRKEYLARDIHVHWIVGAAGIFSKAYPLNRLLATVLRRPECADLVTFHHDRLESVVEVAPVWHCTLESGVIVASDFPPIARHGVETQDVDVDSFDRDSLRVALSRAPVPFKPFDF